MGVIDNYDLRETLRSIQPTITAGEATAILDVVRRAAAADHRTDIAEMTMLLRLKDLITQMAGETGIAIAATAGSADLSNLSVGVRELAFACAYLVMDQDLDLVEEEQALVETLAKELALDQDRAGELVSIVDRLVRSAE